MIEDPAFGGYERDALVACLTPPLLKTAVRETIQRRSFGSLIREHHPVS